MPHPRYSLSTLLVMVAFATPLAHATPTPPDRIFSNGFSQTLVIEGNAGYPGPLATARVEARFGDVVATTTTAADGTYQVGIEVDLIDPDAIVELIARGSGTQSHLVWASPLGPAERLLTLAGSDYRIDFADDPFVYLSPRSTVAAAAARAFNGWQPITDRATFWRAVRSRQSKNNDLVYALALVARGALALPAGADDTFAAALALVPSRALLAAYKALDQTDNCWDAPASDYCDVLTNLPLDAHMFPAVAWVSGELYSRAVAFRTTAEDENGIVPKATGATVLSGSVGNGQAVAATAILLPDGGYELSPADSGVFYSYESVEYIGGVSPPVPTRVESTRIYFRLVPGPAGQIEFVQSREQRTVYPDNPEIPDKYQPYERNGMPMLSGNNPLPPELLGALPNLAGSRLVLPSPLPRPQDASVDWDALHGYDVHVFGTDSGTAERSGQPFIFEVTSPDSFTVDSNGRHGEFRFINEEEPGIWRVRMHVTGADFESVVDGMLIPADAGPLTASNVVGIWRSRINRDQCLGLYDDLDQCTRTMTFTLLADGSGTRFNGSQNWPGTWTLASGSDTGRLLFEWWYPDSIPPFLYERRGWELVHETGDQRWVLETYNPYVEDEAAPEPLPIVFNPGIRLIRYDRQ